MKAYKTKGRGFTLVELIIVIIIVGVLAAIAIPKFVTSSKDAKEAALKANLAALRNQVNLYYHQHDQNYPGALKEDGSGNPTGGGDNPDAFVNQLAQYTDKDGKTSATLDRALFPFGQYLQTGIPVNQLAPAGAVGDAVSVTADTGVLAADASPTTGWKFSKVTGQIIANVSAYETW